MMPDFSTFPSPDSFAQSTAGSIGSIVRIRHLRDDFGDNLISIRQLSHISLAGIELGARWPDRPASQSSNKMSLDMFVDSEDFLYNKNDRQQRIPAMASLDGPGCGHHSS